MARNVSALAHSQNGRLQFRSDQLRQQKDTKDSIDAFYRLKAQGHAVQDETLLTQIVQSASTAQGGTEIQDAIFSNFGGGGAGDGITAGDGGGVASGGDGGVGAGSDGGSGVGGSGDGGSGDGGSAGDGGD